MLTLKKFVRSITESQLLTKNKIVKIYTDIFGTTFGKGIQPGRVTSKGRGQTEIIRAYFGDTNEEIEENCRKFLHGGLGIDLEKIDTELGKFQDSSGMYLSVKIIPKEDINADISGTDLYLDKGKPAYIVCKGGTVRKKQLTPVALGLGGKTVSSVDEVIGIISKSSKLTDNDLVRNFAVSMIGELTKNTNVTKYKTFAELAENVSHDMSKDLSKLDFTGLDDRSFNNILNDFGEVAGACFILSALKGKHTVYFPAAANFAVYDYVIDFNDTVKQTGISMKANGGAAPSSFAMSSSVLAMAKANNSHLDFLDDRITRHVLPCLSRLYNGVKLNVVTTKFALLHVLADVFNDSKAKEIQSLLSRYNIIIDEKTFALSVDTVDSVQKSGKLVELLTELNAMCKYGSKSKNTNYTPERVNTEWNGHIKEIKVGCICQPIQKYVTSYLNENFGDQISAIGRAATGGYQMYLINKKDKTLQIQIKPLSGDKAKYHLVDGGSIKNPAQNSVCIELVRQL